MRRSLHWLDTCYKRNKHWLGTGLGVLLLLVILIPYLIPMEQYKTKIETLVSDATGYGAHVDSVGFKLFPSPEIKLIRLRMTRPDKPSINLKDNKKDTEELVADSANIPLKLGSLLAGNIVITRLKLSNMLADQVLLTEFIGSLGSSDDELPPVTEQKTTTDDETSSFELQMVEATSLKLRLKSGAIIGPYHLLVYPDMETGFSKIILSREDKSATLEASNDGEKIRFQLIAENWGHPLGFPVEITSLTANGVQSGSMLTLSSLEAGIFDGKLAGSGDLSWEGDWKSSGKFNSKGVNLVKALQHLDEKSISGKLDADCNFSLKAETPGTLLNNPALNCLYHVANGEFYKGDLEKAASFSSGSEQENDSSTPFDELSGKVVLKNENIEMTDLNLLSATLQVNGTVKIQKYNTLNGRIEVGIKKTASLASVPLKISGTLGDPKFRPSNDAIAGATVGTVLLGPGVGTAIGVNIGKGISKVFGLFKSGDDDEKPVTKLKEK